jgi:hypothetical protein
MHDAAPRYKMLILARMLNCFSSHKVPRLDTLCVFEDTVLGTLSSASFHSIRRPLGQFLPGDRIRIRRGHLAGATGVVVSFAESERCILKIDGLQDGALVIINPSALQLVEAAASESRRS